MISVAEARARLLAPLAPLAAETVALSQASGRVLAKDLAARRTQPPGDLSAMDGYAVRAADLTVMPARLQVTDEIPAGRGDPPPLTPGTAARIFTGALLPAGADGIVLQEDTQRDGAEVIIQSFAPGRHIRAAGMDFAEGARVIAAGAVLNARHIGLAAAAGHAWLEVRRRPLVALLATGDEIVRPGDPLAPGQIVSANSPALTALIEAAGGTVRDLGIVPDRIEALVEAVHGAKGCDLLVTSGGASVGDHDLVQAALGQAGMTLDFWKIAMRPGKPLMVGSFHGARLVGLPGNPVSAYVCALLFLLPAIRSLLGLPSEPSLRPAITMIDLPANGPRAHFLRATVEPTADDGPVRVTPLGNQDSAMLTLLAQADALLHRAPHAPALPAGSPVEIMDLSNHYGR